jgi:hypothetical protein
LAAGNARLQWAWGLQGCLLLDFFCCERDDGERVTRGTDKYLFRAPAQLIPYPLPTCIDCDFHCATTATFEKVRAQLPRHNNTLARRASSPTTSHPPQSKLHHTPWRFSEPPPLHQRALLLATLAKTSKYLQDSFHQTAYPTSNSRLHTTCLPSQAGTRRSTSTRSTATVRRASTCSNAKDMFWVLDGQRYVHGRSPSYEI